MESSTDKTPNNIAARKQINVAIQEGALMRLARILTDIARSQNMPKEPQSELGPKSIKKHS